MINRDAARSIAQQHVDLITAVARIAAQGVVIADEMTIEKPYGWIFFYDTKKYSETRDRRFALIGNSPILVEKQTAEIHNLGTGTPIEPAIADWEAGLWRGSYLAYRHRLNGVAQ